MLAATETHRPILFLDGAVAQLGERGLCKPEVVGSIPISSTISSNLRAAQSREESEICPSRAPGPTQAGSANSALRSLIIE